jgi:hypothetical protein
MREASKARVSLLVFLLFAAGLAAAADGLYGLVRHTRESRKVCLSCHEKTPGTRGLWDLSPAHARGIDCLECHTSAGGTMKGRISGRPETIDPNCMACHSHILEARIDSRVVTVCERREQEHAGTDQSCAKTLARWPLVDLMYTWHVANRVCLCTDCHRNVAHDKGEAGVRYVPKTAYCAGCHYHAAKDDYARMRPLPVIFVEKNPSPQAKEDPR